MTDDTTVFANDLPFTEPQEDPIRALKDSLAFGVSDWSASRDTAWVYGIVMGWGCDEDHEHDWICGSDDAYREFAERFGWDDATLARLRRLHAAFDGLSS